MPTCRAVELSPQRGCRSSAGRFKSGSGALPCTLTGKFADPRAVEHDRFQVCPVVAVGPEYTADFVLVDAEMDTSASSSWMPIG
jgi:hypothetical protein